MLPDMPISKQDYLAVADLLGREPRGLEAIQVRNSTGEPSVVRVSSLVENKPFPTLFWLVDKAINYQLDQFEAEGLIAILQNQIDASAELTAELRQSHVDYIELRERYMRQKIKSKLMDLGYYKDLQKRGIGGIADFTRIRCLHTHYASHLVKPNLVGRMLDSGYL